MSESSHLKARNLLADAFVAHGLGSNLTNSVRLPGRGMTEETKAALEVVEALLLEREKCRAHSELLNRFLWRIAGRLGRITPGNDGVIEADPEELFDAFMQQHLESGDAATTASARVQRAYSERNALAVAFAKAALAAGWKAGQGTDNDPGKDWDPEWRHVVYVELPTGQQVSWHLSPSELALLEGLPLYDGEWDGTFGARDLRWALFDFSISALRDRAVPAETALQLQSATRNEIGAMYEQLRKVIDGGSESMTHSDALELLQKWATAAETPVLYSSDVDFREYPHAVPGAMHAGLPKGVEATSIKHGVVIICDSERSMHLNRERALAGLRAMIKHKEGL